MLEDLLWLYDPDTPTNVPPEGAIGKKRRKVAASQVPDMNHRLPRDVLRTALEAIEKSREVLEEIGIPLHGSEGWVVGAEKSDTGHPMITAGPGLGWTRPAGCHEIHLHGGRFNITGVSIPGVPCLVAGHNNHLAWSIVMALTDQEDVYIETLHPDDPYSYLFKGNWTSMDVRNETIHVRGQRPEVRPVYSTVHGPVIAFDPANHIALSKKRSGYGQHAMNTSAGGFFEMAIATTIDQFAEAVGNLYVAFSIIYADKAGNIAYWLAGRVPDRNSISQLPVPGTGEYEWNGYIPFEEMPRSINPEKGWLGALPGFLPARDWKYVGAAQLGWPGQKEVVADLLNNDSSVTFEELRYTNMAAAAAVYDERAKYLIPFIAEAFDEVGGLGDPRVETAVGFLKDWGEDGYITISEPGAWDEHFRFEATIYETWWSVVKDKVFSDEFGPYSDYVVPNHFRHVMLGENSGVPPSRDYFNGADKNEVIVESLIEALDSLTLEHGTADLTQWLIEIPLFSEFDPACLQTHASASTYKYILEVKGRFPGEANLFPGNSEDPNSPHYADQILMYVDFRFKPCLYTTDDILNNLESTTTLTYPFDLRPRPCAALITDPNSTNNDFEDRCSFIFYLGLILIYLRCRLSGIH
jgi:penicillin amidase